MLKNFVLTIAVMGQFVAQAQEPAPARPVRPYIRTTAEATVKAKPDQDQVEIGVITQAATAQAAASQNAKQLDAVINEVKKTLGAGAELKTVGYSVSPDYRYPKQGGQPTIAGYTANNVLQVTLSDLSQVGKLIDLATQTGANRVQGVQFTLKDESVVQSQALREAAVKARAKAEGLAAAMGVKIARVISAEEGGTNIVRPLGNRAMMAEAAAVQTPVESGTIEVHSSVTLTVEFQ
jgi:uncharacterized protein YggE